MIRQFIRDTIADLANAVARSELAAENARLRAKLQELESANEKLSAQIQELTYDDRDELRARLSAPCPADGMSDEALGKYVYNEWSLQPFHSRKFDVLGKRIRDVLGAGTCPANDLNIHQLATELHRAWTASEMHDWRDVAEMHDWRDVAAKARELFGRPAR